MSLKLKVGGGIQGRKCVGEENGNVVGQPPPCFALLEDLNKCPRKVLEEFSLQDSFSLSPFLSFMLIL